MRDMDFSHINFVKCRTPKREPRRDSKCKWHEDGHRCPTCIGDSLCLKLLVSQQPGTCVHLKAQ